MMRYESKYTDELMHGCRSSKKMSSGRPSDKKKVAYVYGNKDADAINELSKKYGYQAMNEHLKSINSRMGHEAKRLTWDVKLDEKIKKKRKEKEKEKYPWKK